MKFLLEFVSCCGAVRPTAPTSHPPSIAEEERSLVRTSSRIRRRRKRGRSGPASLNSADWRPSLSSISEDNVAALVVDRAAGDERAMKRKSGQDRKGVHVRRHGEDYGRGSFAPAIPAFSPTPFMF